MVILASGSEWRRELLGWLEIPFVVEESGFDERSVEESDPEALVGTLAVAKARAVAGRLNEGLVIGSDTVVALGEEEETEIIGKPKDLEEAREILEKLRGRAHKVYTGVAVVEVETGEIRVEVVESEVSFRDYSDKELEAYLESGESIGKAGAYQITGGASRLVEDVVGSVTSVVGLPLIETAALLEEFGVMIPVRVAQVIADKTGYLS